MLAAGKSVAVGPKFAVFRTPFTQIATKPKLALEPILNPSVEVF